MYIWKENIFWCLSCCACLYVHTNASSISLIAGQHHLRSTLDITGIWRQKLIWLHECGAPIYLQHIVPNSFLPTGGAVLVPLQCWLGNNHSMKNDCSPDCSSVEVYICTMCSIQWFVVPMRLSTMISQFDLMLMETSYRGLMGDPLLWFKGTRTIHLLEYCWRDKFCAVLLQWHQISLEESCRFDPVAYQMVILTGKKIRGLIQIIFLDSVGLGKAQIQFCLPSCSIWKPNFVQIILCRAILERHSLEASSTLISSFHLFLVLANHVCCTQILPAADHCWS